jgi:cyclic pyranopterin phosphate synthase
MSDRFRIDGEKMSLHPTRVAQWLAAKDDWDKAKDVFPLYVEISPVGYCNHECTFCGVDYMLARPDKPQIAIDVMKGMLSNMAENGVKSVMFAGAGEPLLYKPLADAIVHADGVGIDTAITTNGVLLHEAFARRALAAPRLRWIKVSINGGTRDVYAKIHRAKPEDFDKVLRNLAAAVKIRRELGSACTLGAQLVALPETQGTSKARPLLRETYPSNLESARPLAEALRDIGLDYLVIKPYSQHLMSDETRVYEGTVYANARAWAADLASLSTRDFKVLVRHETMQHLEEASRGYQTCHATPFHWAYVEADGEVWGCSAYLGRQENGVEYGDDRFRYGNVNQESFSSIWRGDRRKANWEYVRHGLDISQCRVNCRMHAVNLYLEQITHPSAHVNFI